MHSPKFSKVKRYYDSGLWNTEMVRNAVVKGWITADEYEEITGEPYEGDDPQATDSDYQAALSELGVSV